MTPMQRYLADLDSGDIHPDPAQASTVEYLERIFQNLASEPAQPTRKGLSRFFKKKCAIEPVKGLYMWGGVGRGKTYLMDLFFDTLPFDKKQRTHFHRFMQGVQDQLKNLRDQQDPLDTIAENTARNIRILCLDEFQVTDIADAMILAGLLEGLFRRGVSLVTTSNTQPDLLYKDGLQRDRFLPAIGLLNKHTTVLNVDGDHDYRLRALDKARTWLSPIVDGTRPQMHAYFCQLETTTHKSDPLMILNRPIPVIQRSEGIAWFEFNALCDGPRGQADYIELARIFNTVLISGIEIMGWEQDDKARRFIELVDEFYDRHVNVIASAHAQPDKIYQGERLAGMFERTSSRLLEMQSREYMSRQHRH